MTNEILRRASDALLSPIEIGGLSRRDARDLRRAVDRQAASGIVRAAGVQAHAYVADTVLAMTSYVADTGLSQVARLSRREEDLIREAPLGTARYAAIVDTFAGRVAGEIEKLGNRR